MQLTDILTVLEDLAPLSLAESWDNVGLLLGDRTANVDRVLTCLTLTPDVAAEAVDCGAQLVVTHHPLLFKAVQRITGETHEGRTLLALMRGGVAVYSPHTAWDNAPQGINQQLAELLGLHNIRPLRRRKSDEFKVVTFVPAEHVAAVQQALWDSGGGVIGDYRCCSFLTHGTGTFFGSDATNPAVGAAGRLEQVTEQRLEVVVPAARLSAALAALRSAHPYEEPAIDVFRLEPRVTELGSGRVGRLPQPTSLRALSDQVSRSLPARVEWTGADDLVIEQLGIACGAAGDFWSDAQRAGCQALLTGEARFHTVLAAREASCGLILAGHYATERPAMERLAGMLAERCPGVTVSASDHECDPLRALS